jgi:hypothetical protein
LLEDFDSQYKPHHEHQASAMRDRHGEGLKRQLRRSYPRQRPWMTPVDEPEDAETDD